MTPFRKSQMKSVLEGVIRWAAPSMQSATALREAMEELARDGQLWADLEQAKALPAEAHHDANINEQ